MRFTAPLVAILALVFGASCGSERPDPDIPACKTAMAAQYDRAMNDPSLPSASRPPACEGVDGKTLERLAGEIVEESLTDQ